MTSSEQLKSLIEELHEINRQFAEAARPLEHVEELNDEARDKLGKELRARFARWQAITQKIHEFLEQPVAVDPAARR